MPAGPDDHCGLPNLLWIICLDEVYDIKTAQSCEATLPSDVRTFLLDLRARKAGYVHFNARQYDEAIVICKKVASENPTFAYVHFCLALGYWGKRMYPQVIEEWKAFGQLSDDRNESNFAYAMEQGFRSAGWKGVLTNGIEARQAQRKTGYYSAYMIAMLYADLGDKDQAFQWLNTAYRERDRLLISLKTDFQLDPLRSDLRFSEMAHKVGLPQ